MSTIEATYSETQLSGFVVFLIRNADNGTDFRPKQGPQWKTLVTTIHQLPAELLIAIFEECKRSSQPPRYFSPTPSMITVTCVCRYWRHLSINTPTLWTQINIDDYARRNLRIASLYLERSAP